MLKNLFITAHAGQGSSKSYSGSSVNDPALRQAVRDSNALNASVLRGNPGQALRNGARQVSRDAGGATVRTGSATIRQNKGGANTIVGGAYTQAAAKRGRRATRD